jgi:N-acetyl sugar amidotransferase
MKPDSLSIKQCAISVMDTIADPGISFDDKGICNYYYEYQTKKLLRDFSADPNKLNEIISVIKNEGEGKAYDCVIGVSGGVDSTYLAYLTKQWGLRPLAVHLDNGWNSELAVKNIENTLNKLQIDLTTKVLDWHEFKSLQISFLKSSTPDGEIPTDHAIFATLFETAAKHSIKYILNGNNFTTESVMPITWSYGHIDWKYIKTIHRQFGNRSLKNYPHLTLFRYLYYTLFKRIRIVSILNYMPYNKAEAMHVLQDKLSWKYYGGKHYESVYTRFFQGYWLPEKFKIDKRKAHLSTLIFSKQITKQEAMTELEKPIYPETLKEEDLQFVLKKLELTQQEFQSLKESSIKTFRNYPTSYKLHIKLRKLLNFLRGKKIMYS